MSDVSDLIKKFEKARDLFEAAEIVEKIQEVIDRLKAGEPTGLVVAGLLADLIETLGDKLGPLGPVIAAYAKAFRAAIQALIGSLYEKYRKAREGFDHKTAAGLVTQDPQVAEFLRLTYALEKLKEAEEKKKKAEKEAKEAAKKQAKAVGGQTRATSGSGDFKGELKAHGPAARAGRASG